MGVLDYSFNKANNDKASIALLSVAKDIVDQETGQRGYLITGKDEFLEPYNKGKEQVKIHLKMLHTILDNAFDRNEMREGINKLCELTDSWNKNAAVPEMSLRRDVDAGLKDFSEIQAIVISKLGKNILDEIRGILNKMNDGFEKAGNEHGMVLMAQIAKSIVDQETGQRGFLVTGDEEFLGPYNEGKKGLEKHFKGLNLLFDNAYDINLTRRNINELENLINLWLVKAAGPEIALRKEIDKHDVTLTNITLIVESKDGKYLMDSLRSLLDEFINEENMLNIGRQKRSSEAANRTILYVIIGSAGTIIMTLISGWFISGTITRKLNDFTEVSKGIAEGDLSKQISLYSKDEIGILAENFRKMTTGLQNISKKQTDENWLKSNIAEILSMSQGADNLKVLSSKIVHEVSKLMDTGYCIFYCTNFDSKDTLYTPKASYGLKKNDNKTLQFKLGEGLVGQCALDKKPILVTNVPSDNIKVSVGFAEAAPLNVLLQPIVFEEDVLGIIEIASLVEFNELQKAFLEQLSARIGVIINNVRASIEIRLLLDESRKLSDRLQIEQENLQKRSEELDRSNKELDDFAYTASHDLKEPLRGIHNYSSFLIEDYKDKLGEDGKNKLLTLMKLSQHLEELINDLLFYSRVGRTRDSYQKTNLNNIVVEVIETLQIRIDELGVDVRIPNKLPITHCDKTRIKDVFSNLISNAIKYNDKEKKWVEIGYEKDETHGGYTFYVKDNGIGIREKHFDSAFKIFKQLHGRGKYGGGTGAGLAIVKKIVEKHGGKTWIDSTFGKGSTFYFTLGTLRQV